MFINNNNILHVIVVLFFFSVQEVASADDAMLWNSVSDSIATQTDPTAPNEICLHGKAYAMSDEGDGDYLKIVPNK